MTSLQHHLAALEQAIQEYNNAPRRMVIPRERHIKPANKPDMLHKGNNTAE